MRRGDRRHDPLLDREVIRRLYAYVAFRIGDSPDADDVVSDTIERSLRYRRNYDPARGEPIDWLIGIARRRIAALYSQPVVLVPLDSSEGAEDTGAFEQQVVERLALAAAVARLEDRDRELVSLHYGADLAPQQIARLLDMRPNAVEVALHRARARLRALLEREPAWEGSAGTGDETVSL